MNMPFQTFDEQGDASLCGARVAALRAELKRRGVDGFLIPRADEHQGEYVPKRAERLAWLTGFTGSAGLAIVLMEKAAVFVDGRYTLQVRNQTDTTLFETLDLMNDGPTTWIEANLSKGARLGYDPWLHTQGAIERLRISVERAGGSLAPLSPNPLDQVWPDQPEPPHARAVPHPLELAGETSESKRSRLAEELKKRGTDAAVVTLPDSICWLLNIRGADVPHTPFVLSFARLNADSSVDLFLDPRKNSPVRASDPCQLPKACKNEAELQGTRRAHVRDGAALSRFLAWFAREAPKAKLTEIDAVEKLEGFRRATGALRDVSFDSISGAGPNGAIVHYRVTKKTNRRVETGQLFLIDSGAQFEDGTTDVTRTIAVGQPSPEMRDRFTRVLKG